MNTLLSFGLALLSVTLAIGASADDKAQKLPAQNDALVAAAQDSTPPKPKDVVVMLQPRHIVEATVTGKAHLGINPRIISHGIRLGDFTPEGWEDRWKLISKRFATSKYTMYLDPGYIRSGKKTLHELGVLTLKFADGATAQVALPDLTNDGKGNLVDGDGRPLPKSPALIALYLGADGNSYYDEDGTKLAASLNKPGVKKPDTQAQTPPKLNVTFTMLRGQHVVDATMTGKLDTEVKSEISTSPIQLGRFTPEGWEDQWKVASRFFAGSKSDRGMHLKLGYTFRRKTVHKPGVLTLKFADGTTARVALPDLTFDTRGNAVDGAGRPVPKAKIGTRIYLGSNGNSYYDEEGTKLAASLKKSDTPVQASPKPPAKTPLPFRTWTSATGTYTIQARFVSLKGGVLTLERESGKTITLQVEKLSKTDRAYVKAKAASK